MEAITSFFQRVFSNIYRPEFGISDIVEICILAFFLYQFIKWVKSTRALILLKGILVIACFLAIAFICNFTVILWIAEKAISVAIVALVVIFQPELRSALEKLGEKEYFKDAHPFKKTTTEMLTEDNINTIIDACYDMSNRNDDALIIITQDNRINEVIEAGNFKDSGVVIDGCITKELLCHIFDKNTSLRDGSAVISDNRIAMAECMFNDWDDNPETAGLPQNNYNRAKLVTKVEECYAIIVSGSGVSFVRNGEVEKDARNNEYLKKVDFRYKLVKLSKLEVKENPKSPFLKKGGDLNGK